MGIRPESHCLSRAKAYCPHVRISILTFTLAVVLVVPRTEQTVLGQAELSKLSSVLADLAGLLWRGEWPHRHE